MSSYGSYGSALSGGVAAQLPVRVSVYVNGSNELSGKRVVLDRAESLPANVTRIAKKLGMEKSCTRPLLYTAQGISVEEPDEIIEGEVLYFEPRGRNFLQKKFKASKNRGSKPETKPSKAATPLTNAQRQGQGQGQGVTQGQDIGKTKASVSSNRASPLGSPLDKIKAAAQNRMKRTNSLEYDLMFKFILVGNTAVGKSCLLLRFTDRRFRELHEATIGVDFGTETVKLKDKLVKIQIWDTAGQEDFQAITRAYYREAAAALVVYDITCRESFGEVRTWLRNVRSSSTNRALTITLVGNKCDLEAGRVVSKEEGEALARENGLMFFETSAKTGAMVETSFIRTASTVLRKLDQGLIDVDDSSHGVRLGAKAKPKKNATPVVVAQRSRHDDDDERACYCF